MGVKDGLYILCKNVCIEGDFRMSSEDGLWRGIGQKGLC